MKLSLFCLGSRAAGVIVGSAGSAVDKCHKVEAAKTIDRSCLHMVAINVTS